jgi:hypothetical protein
LLLLLLLADVLAAAAAPAAAVHLQVGSLYIIITSWQTFKVFAN